MTVNLLYTDVEDALRDSVRDLLSKRATAADILARIETAEPADPALWKALATDLGCAGLAIPEELGGAGASWREAAVVLEELGRSVAPLPYLTSSVIATAALLAVPRTDAVTGLLADLASGARTAALAVPFADAPGAPMPSTVDADGATLAGEIRGVAGAVTADVLLVPTRSGLYATEAGTRTPVVSLDMTRPLADLAFPQAAADPLAPAEETRVAVRAALRTGAALLASEQLGLAGWCLESTVEYLKTRRQFGRQVGSFQALKHRLADLWVDVTQARAVARYAAACVADADLDTPVAAALAQAFCSTVAVRAAEECIQLHGGIGFTWEHPAHLYLKRAKSAAIALGTPDRHRAALSALVNLEA